VDPTAATELAFGSLKVDHQSGPLSVYARNTGTAPLVISSVMVGGGHPADYAKPTDTCSGNTIAPGDWCQVSLTFKPGGVGDRGASLFFQANDQGQPHRLSVTGWGEDDPPAPAVTAPVDNGDKNRDDEIVCFTICK
jgi:hypothetical protein